MVDEHRSCESECDTELNAHRKSQELCDVAKLPAQLRDQWTDRKLWDSLTYVFPCDSVQLSVGIETLSVRH